MHYIFKVEVHTQFNIAADKYHTIKTNIYQDLRFLI